MHALGPHMDAVAKHQAQEELTTVSIRGREGTGKTTLARVLAHGIHERLDRMAHSIEPTTLHMKQQREAMRKGYVVRLLGGEELRNLTATMEALPPGRNRILIFDDSSFMGASASKLVVDAKKAVSKIRHTAAGDVKVILFFIFHYSKALDPYLRDTHFIAHTNITQPELRAMRDLYGPQDMTTLANYYSALQVQRQTGTATFTLDGQSRQQRQYGRVRYLPTTVSYKYSDPFRIAAFHDGSALHITVYPGAGPEPKPDPLGISACGICAAAGNAAAGGGEIKPQVPMSELHAWCETQVNKPDIIGSALRGIFLRRHGRDPTYRDRNLMIEILTRLENNGICSVDDMAREHFRHDPAAAERFIAGAGKRTAVPLTKRAAFTLKFGIDGLRRPAEKAITPPSEEQRDAVLEELR